MVQTPDPAVLPQSDVWKSLEWLVEEPASLAAGRRGWRHRISQSRAGTVLAGLGLARCVGLAACLVLLVGVAGWALWPAPQAPATRPPVPPALPRIEAPFAPGAMRKLTRNEAIALNAATATGDTSVPGAATFVLNSPQPTDYQRSIECLAQAIHYEAGSEGVDGGRAVAQVILNRVRHPAFPDTVCGVVYEGAKRATGCQFTFACDGSLSRVPSAGAWRRARAIAVSALAGDVYAAVGWSTHYHADYVVPYWASSLRKTATVGAHIFYRWSGKWGEADAFDRRYAGAEPLAALLVGVEASGAAEGEAAIGNNETTTPELPAARPVLLSLQRDGTVSEPTRDPRVKEIGLVDRQVLMHPRSGPAESAADQGDGGKAP